MFQTEFKEYQPPPIERLTYRNWQPRELFALPMISGRCSTVVIDLCAPQKGLSERRRAAKEITYRESMK